MSDNRIQFRLNRELDADIQQELDGYENRTERVKELLRYGIMHEDRMRALSEGKVVIESRCVKLTPQQQNFIHLTKQMKQREPV